jgi:hypothetical protein
MRSQRRQLSLCLSGLLPVMQIFVAAYQSSLESEIVAAVKQAYSLEERLFAERDRYSSWEDVYHHYRQGFGEEIARRLADYSWWPEGNGLRDGDRSMAVPATVVVLEASDTLAVAVHPTPVVLQELWGLKRYTVDRLQREHARWVIVDSKSTNEMPDKQPQSAAQHL